MFIVKKLNNIIDKEVTEDETIKLDNIKNMVNRKIKKVTSKNKKNTKKSPKKSPELLQHMAYHVGS